MTKTRDADREPFTLRYGPLEAMLSRLMDVSGKAIVTRFRKLRPKFAADGLLTDTGNRVDYDLSRILAIVQQRVPGDVVEVELEHGKHHGWEYEVKVLTAQGRVREVKLNARSGEVRKVEDD